MHQSINLVIKLLYKKRNKYLADDLMEQFPDIIVNLQIT